MGKDDINEITETHSFNQSGWLLTPSWPIKPIISCQQLLLVDKYYRLSCLVQVLSNHQYAKW